MSNAKSPQTAPRRFGFGKALLIVGVLAAAALGYMWWYGVNVAPAEAHKRDQAACAAFNAGLQKAHAAFTANDNAGYIDEFFKGNDAALEAADPNGKLNELLIQVGMQRLSINYEMDALTLMNSLEGMATRVQSAEYCAGILGVGSPKP